MYDDYDGVRLLAICSSSTCVLTDWIKILDITLDSHSFIEDPSVEDISN